MAIAKIPLLPRSAGIALCNRAVSLLSGSGCVLAVPCVQCLLKSFGARCVWECVLINCINGQL